MRFNKILLVTKVGGERVDESLLLANEIEQSQELKDAGISVIRNMPYSDDPSLSKTLMVSIGGDGTVLHCAKTAFELNIPILGINLGNLGFLTDISKTEAIQVLATINDESSWVSEERILLVTETTNPDFTDQVESFAFNDFVISDLYSDTVIKYDLNIGGHHAGHHKANAVIVSTPTGSTAYSLFVGGSILAPDLDVIAVSPVAAMSMSSRPVVASGKCTITIDVKHPKRDDHLEDGYHDSIESTLCLKSDGQTIELDQFLVAEEEQFYLFKIKIKKHDKHVTLLHHKDYNFFSRMSEKLGWNK